jgi:hypothetical protein
MAAVCFRFEDRLDGASNFLSWKVRATLLLEENDLWDILKSVVTPPTDLQQLVTHNKSEMKAKRMILDAIKHHLIPHISKKKTAKEMIDALVSLYQSENINRKMILRNKLKSIVMTKSDSVTSYLMKVTQVRDQLVVVGKKVADAKLVIMAINGFSTSWEPFVKGICTQENLHNLERLWEDNIWEETQMEPKADKKDGEENLALFGQSNKGRGKGSNKGKRKCEESTSQRRKKDLSKIKCFNCHKQNHYASQCPDKKKGKGE